MGAIRLNISLPEEIVREIERRSGPRKKNQFILEAVEQRLEGMKQKELEALLKKGYKLRKEEGLSIAKEYEAADLEGWDEY